MIRVPNLSAPAVDAAGRFTDAWVGFFTAITGQPSAIRPVAVGASPFSYRAPDDGHVRLMGGTVSAVSLIRGVVSIPAGQTSGFIPVSAGDTLVVTYTVAPIIHFIPG